MIGAEQRQRFVGNPQPHLGSTVAPALKLNYVMTILSAGLIVAFLAEWTEKTH
jgi:hypothetical protein